MNYFSYRDDQFWHMLDEKGDSLCGCEISEPALLAGVLIRSEGILTYLDLCGKCREVQKGVD